MAGNPNAFQFKVYLEPYGYGVFRLGEDNIQKVKSKSVLDNAKIWPNPADSKLNINIDAGNFDNAEIKLLSLLGRELLKTEINAKTKNATIDINSINNGMYLIKIIVDGQEAHTQKLTIAH